jgi:hypothetical protein
MLPGVWSALPAGARTGFAGVTKETVRFDWIVL